MLKRKGFTSLESIVSMGILLMIIYIITFCLNNTSKLLNDTDKYMYMLNTAQNHINQEKFNVKNNKDYINQEKRLNKDDLIINKKIIKIDKHYKLYEIIVEVKSKDRSIKLNSYVTKK